VVAAPSAHWQNPVIVLHTPPAQSEQLREHGHPLGMPEQPGGQFPMVVVVVDEVVVVVSVVDVVLVVVVVVVAPGFDDGTHSSRRWISVTSSGPNWLLMWATVVPNFALDFAL